MREFLSDNGIPFDDRNIRRSEEARDELAERTGKLVVPQVFWRDHHVLGFDPVALEALAVSYREAVA